MSPEGQDFQLVSSAAIMVFKGNTAEVGCLCPLAKWVLVSMVTHHWSHHGQEGFIQWSHITGHISGQEGFIQKYTGYIRLAGKRCMPVLSSFYKFKTPY